MKNATLVLVALLTVVALLVGGLGQAKAGFVYDFEDIALGTISTPLTFPILSDTKGGVTAYFQPNGQNASFTIDSARNISIEQHVGSPGSGHVLEAFAPFLVISFSQYISSISLGFASDGTDFTLNAYRQDGNPYYSGGANIPGHGEHSGGTITFSNPTTPFSQVILSDTDSGYFIVDNIDIVPVNAVPEPATITMLGIGIACMAGYGWRRRKQSVRA